MSHHLLYATIFLSIIIVGQVLPSYAERLLPDETQFQTGDLIWPKDRGSSVPYAGQPTDSPESSHTQWEKERAAFLEKIRRQGEAAPAHERRFADLLATLSYEDFLALYLADRRPGSPVPFGTFPLYVGHVGIVLVEGGEIFVVEAVIPAVRRVKYRDWLTERSNADVWHGRILRASLEERAAVAQTALTQVGKVYNFWNLDLNDGAGFYCSKLVWWGVFNALQFAIDNNSEPARSFWFSPKQLMAVQRMQLLFEPSPYK